MEIISLMVAPRKLFLFTQLVPTKETELFLAKELPFLINEFDEVKIFPFLVNSNSVPLEFLSSSKVELIHLTAVKNSRSLNIIFNTSRIFLIEFIRSPVRYKLGYLRRFRYYFSYLKQIVLKAMLLENNLKDSESLGVFYSYWGYEWPIVLSILKSKGIISGFTFRLHGADLYENRSFSGILPFRHFVHSQVSRIVFAARNPMEYYKTRFPNVVKKVYYFPLGVAEEGINVNNNSEKLRIVSCSAIIPLKRVDLIFEILSKLNVDFEWTHFGSGSGFDQLKLLVDQSEVKEKIILRGNVSNSEIINHYLSYPVDVFLHFSTTEGGTPIAIQEAIMAGIPVIACDVGGVSDVVNEETGVLLPVNFDHLFLIELLSKFRLSKYVFSEFRQGVRKYAEKNFSASTNYQHFVNFLMQDIT